MTDQVCSNLGTAEKTTKTHMRAHTSVTYTHMRPKRKDQLQDKNKYTNDDPWRLLADMCTYMHATSCTDTQLKHFLKKIWVKLNHIILRGGGGVLKRPHN